ncbi:hypothetical protein BKA83DRAFT_4511324 [Pisolithus microcarpus]|nr:hypothetical protein BKA83DRAFT_4511324 [Pisolithus microcarpus]
MSTLRSSSRRSARLARRQSSSSPMASSSSRSHLPYVRNSSRGSRDSSRGFRGRGLGGIGMEDTQNTGGVAPRATFTRGTANRGSTRGAKGKAPAVSGESVRGLQVHWDQDPTRTERLIHWLLNHAADRHILFHDKNTGQSSSAPPPAAGDKPSGRNKKEVRLAIAKCIFEDDPMYGEQYATNPDKFQLCVMNRLVTLKEKYREHAKSLKQTGGGVAPGTENNLCEAITKTFPYFDDLDLIWKGNPSFDARPFMSDQQKNRAEEMLALIILQLQMVRFLYM